MTDSQKRVLKSYVTGLSGEIQGKGEHPFQIVLVQLSTGITETNVSLTLPGRQVIALEDIPLP